MINIFIIKHNSVKDTLADVHIYRYYTACMHTKAWVVVSLSVCPRLLSSIQYQKFGGII